MLQHIKGKFTMGKLKSSFVAKCRSYDFPSKCQSDDFSSFLGISDQLGAIYSICRQVMHFNGKFTVKKLKFSSFVVKFRSNDFPSE